MTPQRVQQLEGRLEVMLDTLKGYQDEIADLKAQLEIQTNLYAVLVVNSDLISTQLFMYQEQLMQAQNENVEGVT